MSTPSNIDEKTLLAAERVAELLARAGVDSVLIGAVALAAHNYARETSDVDLGVATEPSRLAELAKILRANGFTVEISEPDGNDPLGGVLRVIAPGCEPIEVVNFYNPPANGFPALIRGAVKEASPLRVGVSLGVASVPYLVLSKLYAGGLKSKLDVIQLLRRNPDQDIEELRAICRRFRLDRKLEVWFRELKASEEE